MFMMDWMRNQLADMEPRHNWLESFRICGWRFKSDLDKNCWLHVQFKLCHIDQTKRRHNNTVISCIVWSYYGIWQNISNFSEVLIFSRVGTVIMETWSDARITRSWKFEHMAIIPWWIFYFFCYSVKFKFCW